MKLLALAVLLLLAGGCANMTPGKTIAIAVGAAAATAVLVSQDDDDDDRRCGDVTLVSGRQETICR